MKATWNGVVIAESDDIVVFEGDHYFPMEDIKRGYFTDSDKHTSDAVKGRANYLTVMVDGEINEDAAVCYPEPKEAARVIKNHVSFLKGIRLK